MNEFINYEGFKVAILVDNNSNSDIFYRAVAIGGEKGRERLNILEIFLTNVIKLPNFIYPKSHIAKDVSLGVSNQILANSTVGTDVKIGNGVIINSSASIDREYIINNGVHIGPGVYISLLLYI